MSSVRRQEGVFWSPPLLNACEPLRKSWDALPSSGKSWDSVQTILDTPFSSHQAISSCGEGGTHVFRVVAPIFSRMAAHGGKRVEVTQGGLRQSDPPL
jgi:hypothetical protein